MTPKQYEDYIGELYTSKGYKVTVSPLSNDWGIDVIATKDNEKIGIQAKMYGNSNRSVNRRIIMELYGACAYQDCTKAVLATDGEILSDAVQVAKKLGIEILQTPSNIQQQLPQPQRVQSSISNSSNNCMSFDEAWEKYIFPLKGKILHNSRSPNHIIEVNWAGIERITSNGRKGKIDIEGFKLAYNVLMEQGHITRDYINPQVDKRCSSGIVLILEQLPFVEKTQSPIELRLKKHS